MIHALPSFRSQASSNTQNLSVERVQVFLVGIPPILPPKDFFIMGKAESLDFQGVLNTGPSRHEY